MLDLADFWLLLCVGEFLFDYFRRSPFSTRNQLAIQQAGSKRSSVYIKLIHGALGSASLRLNRMH